MRKLKLAKGQGVIEYAGALVIAATLVASVLAVGPDGVSNLFSEILSQVQDYFVNDALNDLNADN